MEAFIGSDKKAFSLADLKAFPKFIRFDEVYLVYWAGLQSIEKKCQLFGDFLPSIKGALNDSKEIVFSVRINQNDPSQFRNHSTFLNKLRDEFLAICDSPLRYVFELSFYSDENSVTKVIESILKMPQIVRCSNVEICLGYVSNPIQLPVGEIVQWLNLKTDPDRIELSAQKKEEKFFKIYASSIQNVLEMRDHLTEVLFISQQFRMLKYSNYFFSF